MIEKCVVCEKKTKYNKEDHIDFRIGYIEGSGQLCLNCYDEIYVKKTMENKMPKFLEAIDKLLIAILGLSVVEKREDDRRKKKQRKRKNEKRIGQRRD
tara:strand:- start:635 stop:928 length:294 start_codon:yes stop_codon:yes gene_type:complete